MKEIELLKKLVTIPSVTPIDGGCLALICEHLIPLGFTARRIDSNNKEVANLWITHTAKNLPINANKNVNPTTCFIGHIDVVPTGPLEKWDTPPFEPTEIDGYLYGRGSCDMKGGIAAMVRACADFVKNNPQHNGTIGLLITSDEEGDALEGTTLALQKLTSEGQSFNYGIVGEPTCVDVFGDVIKNGRRGSLSGKITILGKQGHVAYPHLGANAVHLFTPALTEIINTKWDEGNNLFPPTTLQICNVSAGTGTLNVIPGELKVDFNIRHGTISPAKSLKERIHHILDKHKLNYKIDWQTGSNPYLTTKTNLTNIFSESVFEVLNVNPSLETTGGTSDGRFLAQYCEEVVEFGNINATIHQINECVNIEDVKNLKLIYEKVITRIHG